MDCKIRKSAHSDAQRGDYTITTEVIEAVESLDLGQL